MFRQEVSAYENNIKLTENYSGNEAIIVQQFYSHCHIIFKERASFAFPNSPNFVSCLFWHLVIMQSQQKPTSYNILKLMDDSHATLVITQYAIN